MHQIPFVYRKDLYGKAKDLRREQTPSEKHFWKFVLKSEPFNHYTWNRQKPIHQFIVDFYCSALKLVVEIDGDIHKLNQDYDRARTAHLKSLGLTVIRFSNNQVLNSTDTIRQHLQKSLPLQSEPPSFCSSKKGAGG